MAILFSLIDMPDLNVHVSLGYGHVLWGEWEVPLTFVLGLVIFF